MKFGKYLKRHQIYEWADYYVNYKGLKKLIGAFEYQNSEQEIDKFFHSRLLQETDRVNAFFVEKLQDYHQRKEALSNSSKDITADEVHDVLKLCLKLKNFGYLNSEGLRKLCKKFDKKCNFALSEEYLKDLYATPLKDNRGLNDMINELADRLSRFSVPFGITKVAESDLHKKNLWDARNKLARSLRKASEQQKTVIVPMTVEPKTFMAMERTYLKWLREAALICVGGLSLIAFGHELWTGLVCVLIAIYLQFRSYFTYNQRMDIILKRSEGTWEDRIGPLIALGGITFPVVVYLLYILVFGTQGFFHL